jgi:hypothetical protein
VFLDPTHLVVTHIGADASETLLTYGVDYTVATSEGGGTVTRVTPAASGESTRIDRYTPMLQPDTLQNQGALYPARVEAMVNRHTLIAQEIMGRGVLGGAVPTGGNAGQVLSRIGATGVGWLDELIRQDLASSDAGKGAALVVRKLPLAGSVTRSLYDISREAVSVKEFGAIGDGTSHPLSERYATLAEAQAQYAHATALTDEIDWCAWQAAINAQQSGLRSGNIYAPDGDYVTNRTLAATSSVTIRAVRSCARITKTTAGDILQGGAIKVEGLDFFHNGASGSCFVTTGDNSHLIGCGFVPGSTNTSAMVVAKHANVNIDGAVFVGSNAAQWCVDVVADTGNLCINGRIGNQTTMYGNCSGVRFRTGTGGRPEGWDVDAKIIVTGDCSVEVVDCLNVTIYGVLDQATNYGVKCSAPSAGRIEVLRVLCDYIATASGATTGKGVASSNTVAGGVIGLTVHGCHIELCGSGVVLDGTMTAFKVSHCHIEQISFVSIDYTGANSGTINHNTLLGTNTLLQLIDGTTGKDVSVIGNTLDRNGVVTYTPTNTANFEFHGNTGKKFAGWCSGTVVNASGTSSGGFNIPHGLAVTPSIGKISGAVVQTSGGYIDCGFKIISVDATNIRAELFYGTVTVGNLTLNLYASG